MLCSNPVTVGWKTQPPKRAPNRLPISCPMGTFPYFRVAICTRKFNNIRECSVTHNPKVAGSNPAPATKKFKILNGLRSEFGGRFYVWIELRQILGKEFLVKKCSKLSCYADIVCRH